MVIWKAQKVLTYFVIRIIKQCPKEIFFYKKIFFLIKPAMSYIYLIFPQRLDMMVSIVNKRRFTFPKYFFLLHLCLLPNEQDCTG